MGQPCKNFCSLQPYDASVTRSTVMHQLSGRSLVIPFGFLSEDRQTRPCRVRASCSPTNSPEGVGAGDGLSTIVCSTQSSAAGWPRDATIPRDIQYRSSAVSLCNPVTALAGAHHPRPGDTIASCSQSYHLFWRCGCSGRGIDHRKPMVFPSHWQARETLVCSIATHEYRKEPTMCYYTPTD